MADSPKILGVELAAQSRLFSIETVHVRYSNGAEAALERIPAGHWPGAVIVVPVLPDRNVLLVREYTVGTESYEVGLPQGMREPGESPEQTANRELKEEVGFGARRLKLLRDLSVASSVLGFRVQVVLAELLYESPLTGDEPEPLKSFGRNIDALLSGDTDVQITEARSLLALYLAREYLDEKSATA
ncbi:ADP compounds hydrolase NudE [Marinobacter sp. EhC06]|nr:ADP compounds hydrolase NudE [Marinobacter sp. EhN04]OAN87767.1 ADP compounds hydrolase NudE [Marinobacter sp. EhC06]